MYLPSSLVYCPMYWFVVATFVKVVREVVVGAAKYDSQNGASCKLNEPRRPGFSSSAFGEFLWRLLDVFQEQGGCAKLKKCVSGTFALLVLPSGVTNHAEALLLPRPRKVSISDIRHLPRSQISQRYNQCSSIGQPS